MTASTALIRTLFFGDLIISRQVGNSGRINLPARNAILFVSPTPKIDQLTALGTKWPPRIVAPFDRLSTGWTFRHIKSGQKPDRQGGRIFC